MYKTNSVLTAHSYKQTTIWLFYFILNFNTFKEKRKNSKYIYLNWSANPNVPNSMNYPVTYLNVSEEIVTYDEDTSKWTLDMNISYSKYLLFQPMMWNHQKYIFLGKSVNVPVNNLIIYLLCHLTMR